MVQHFHDLRFSPHLRNQQLSSSGVKIGLLLSSEPVIGS